MKNYYPLDYKVRGKMFRCLKKSPVVSILLLLALPRNLEDDSVTLVERQKNNKHTVFKCFGRIFILLLYLQITYELPKNETQLHINSYNRWCKNNQDKQIKVSTNIHEYVDTTIQAIKNYTVYTKLHYYLHFQEHLKLFFKNVCT